MSSINQGWYDLNEGRQFPLSDDATAIDTASSTRLDDDLIVDLVLTVPQSISPETVHLLNVAGFGTGLVISFGVNGDLAAVATIPSNHQDYAGYPVVGTGVGEGIAGRIVIGQRAAFEKFSTLNLEFAVVDGKLAPTAVRPRIGGVDSITIVTFDGEEIEVTGETRIVSGSFLNLSVNGNDIELDADGGVVVSDRYECNSDDAGRVPIRTINGIAPDASGNLVIEGTNCMQIDSSGSSVQLQDTCAEPCCGCDELETVEAAFDNIKSGQDNLRLLLNEILSRQSNLELNFNRSNLPKIT